MFKSFCNSCGTETTGKPVGNRKFTNLVQSQAGLLGLEAVLLCDGKPNHELHLCDACILDLIWKLAVNSPGTNLANRVRAITDGEVRAKNLSKEADSKIEELNRLQTDFTNQKSAYNLVLKELDQRQIKVVEREQAVQQREQKVLEREIAVRKDTDKINKISTDIYMRDEKSKVQEQHIIKLVAEASKKYDHAAKVEKEAQGRIAEHAKANAELQEAKTSLDVRTKDVQQRESQIMERESSVKAMNSYLEKRVKDITAKEKLADEREARLVEIEKRLTTDHKKMAVAQMEMQRARAS